MGSESATLQDSLSYNTKHHQEALAVPGATETAQRLLLSGMKMDDEEMGELEEELRREI